MKTLRRTIPLRFCAGAAGVGAAFSNINVVVPLQLNALHRPAALTGLVLGAGTLAVAAGALAAGVSEARVGGGRRLLAVAMAVTALGGAVFAAADAVAVVAAAAIPVGLGVGVFWVASQHVLGGRSGDPGSEVGFAVHFGAYTCGAMAGSGLTGALILVEERSGMAATGAVRTAGLVGAAAAACALLQWLPRAQRVAATPTRLRALARPTRHLAVQLADLFLVAALALVLPLTPLVLAHGYGFGPLSVGLTMATVSLAKIGGTFTAARLARHGGHRSAIVVLLGAGCALCIALAAAFDASVYVAALLATTLTVSGAWPVVVDAAQARVPPPNRLDLTVLWNVREYAVIAVGTALAGSAYGAFGTPVPLFAAAGALVATAAVCAARALRRPVWREPTAVAA